MVGNALLVLLVVVACGHEHAGVKFSHNTITLPTFSNVYSRNASVALIDTGSTRCKVGIGVAALA